MKGSGARTPGKAYSSRRTIVTLPSTPLYPKADFPSEKVCTKCGDHKPLDHFAIDKRIPSGRSSWCKKCTSLYQKGLRDRKAEARKTMTLPESKVCSYENCTHSGAMQPLSSFHKCSSNDDGHSNICKTCISVKQKLSAERTKYKRKENCRKWYQNNKEVAKAKSNKWRKDHPEQAKETKQAYRATHKEEIKASQRAVIKKKPKYYNRMKNAYRRKHWEQKIVGECRRRAKKKGVPFDMKESDLHDPKTGKLPEFCPIFKDIRIDYNAGPDRRCWPSVDRIVPALGYVTGNVWVISFVANTCKSSRKAKDISVSLQATGSRRIPSIAKVTTPSAKADGFSQHARPYIRPR
jgi:hypothetical protein